MAQARSSRLIKLGAFAGLVCVALAAFFVFAHRADAQQRDRANGWQVCNETSFVLEAATGRPDNRSIIVQGWTRLRPGECRTAIAAPLARGTHYLYARTSSAHRGGRRQWAGDGILCVDPASSFSIENPPQCAPQGLEERRFRRVQINKRDSWRTSFSEAQQYTLARARQRGLQRLLDDAGYSVPEGRRGVDPRAIAQAIAQFRSVARLSPNASEDQLIDALETAARRRASQVGLTLCNRTNARVWTAVGRRRGEGWESRGWWPLNADTCVRVIDEVLMQERYFVYAAMDTPEGSRYLAAGEPFCTSPSRFAILGRGECEGRYYRTEPFAAINARGREGLVVEFETRDFLDVGVRPRMAAATPDGTEAPASDAQRRGFAPPSAPTQDRGTGE
ncbi:MAG: DUF1036 domain-containing protein [Hyphomonadaceae bacterium JAD_PAG50586_4]|nr:MAG: DUF1036 domain-containing protein [Hyphomonadaceae bacterium JAD_PAG50586_4]